MKQQLFKPLLFLFLVSQAFAHPHTFIDVKPTLKIKNTTIEKLHIKWILDEMTSMMLIMELDEDGNKKIDKKENSYIYENYFKSLENYNFYMQIKSNNKIVSFTPKNFKASIKKDKLIYAFDILKPLNIKNLKIDFFDEELFVAMMIEKEFIKIANIDKSKANKLKKDIFGVN